jgi:hypothetical protein
MSMEKSGWRGKQGPDFTELTLGCVRDLDYIPNIMLSASNYLRSTVKVP